MANLLDLSLITPGFPGTDHAVLKAERPEINC